VSDRLDELRRQRALVQQHLDWLDAEIAATAAPKRTAEPTAASNAHLRPDTRSPIESIALREAPELGALLAAQKSAPANSAADVKRGCFIAFALLFVVLGLAVYGLYLYSRSRH
jgi:hypothetical protein